MSAEHRTDAGLWDRLDRRFDAAHDPDGLRAHGVHLLAARRWRAVGRPVPAAILADERTAARVALAAPVLLERVRAVLDGPLLLFKGPEIAARYPDPALRPYGDLDLLVADAPSAQRALLAAGFAEVADFRFPHQQRPLAWRDWPLLLEVHSAPPWLPWMTPPAHGDLLRRAVPSATEVPGVLAPAPADHALLAAAHAWRHVPLRRLLDLVDVEVMTVAAGCDPADLRAAARRAGLGPVWATTERAVAALLRDPPGRSAPVATWAGHLRSGRDRTLAERHLAVWLGALWAPGPAAKLRALAAAVAADLRPLDGEPWPAKLRRLGRAVPDAFAPGTARDRAGPLPPPDGRP